MHEDYKDASQNTNQQPIIHSLPAQQPVSASTSTKRFIIILSFLGVFLIGAFFSFNTLQNRATETQPVDEASEATDLPKSSETSEEPAKYQSTMMQTTTSTSCPTTRTRAVDARDGHTYWVQKLADGKCWMLTDLAYEGGGIDTYKDVKALTLSSSVVTKNATVAEYSIPGGAHPTVDPADPSTSTDGGVTNPQFGYRYDWCAAMGVQQDTGACLKDSSTPIPDKSVSICPAGWRLPIADEFKALNDAVNGSRVDTDEGLRMVWLGQWGGGDRGSATALRFYWSSDHNSTHVSYGMSVKSDSVTPTGAVTSQSNTNYVRCIAI